MILIGPTGNVVRGDVLDVSKAGLEAALKAYDKQLYVKWNPKKCRGHGCWEVRRKPDEKSMIFQGEFQGKKFYSLEYKELDIISHVMDSAFLSYEIVTKIKGMDQWQKSGMRHRSDYEKASEYVGEALANEQKNQAKAEQDLFKEAVYGMKQEKRAMRELREIIGRGENPNNLAKFWK